ncbi:MAG: hypothetical protein KAS94_03510 [Desulfobulbaceae bacterium]|nr:hypothetical protein [Desulfobulbaceae bacterium]
MPRSFLGQQLSKMFGCPGTSGAVEMISQLHMFFCLTSLGILAGMVEAVFTSFFFIYIFGWKYNGLAGGTSTLRVPTITY